MAYLTSCHVYVCPHQPLTWQDMPTLHQGATQGQAGLWSQKPLPARGMVRRLVLEATDHWGRKREQLCLQQLVLTPQVFRSSFCPLGNQKRRGVSVSPNGLSCGESAQKVCFAVFMVPPWSFRLPWEKLRKSSIWSPRKSEGQATPDRQGWR